MNTSESTLELPDAQSPDVHLSHPTSGEYSLIWELTSLAWRDALTLDTYLEESDFLTFFPLAKDEGMTTWVLVNKHLPSDQRPILCSSETFRKRCLINDTEGNITEMIIHGVASVFCDPKFRRRGYARRMMRELAQVLGMLCSDIGKIYYADLGCHPLPNNTHIEFQPLMGAGPPRLTHLLPEDLDELCKEDETMIVKAMAGASDGKRRMSIVPDHDQERSRQCDNSDKTIAVKDLALQSIHNEMFCNMSLCH